MKHYLPIRYLYNRFIDAWFEADCRLCLGPIRNPFPYSYSDSYAETGQSEPGFESAVSQVPLRLLCQHCQRRLPWLSECCEVCALPLAAGSDQICGECLKQSPPFDQAFSAFYYRYPVNEWITRLKYSADLSLLPGLNDYFAVALNRYLSSKNQQHQLPEAIIAVPLHPKKQFKRGFNQAALLARHLARHFNITNLSQQAKRIKMTAPQADLDAKQRKLNLKGAFQLRTSLPRRIALIDDVFTTGATFSELSKVCRAAGAEQIQVWSLARAVL